MRTTLFGQKLIQAAEEVLQVEYRAYDKNQYGEALERVVREYDTNALDKKFMFAGIGKKQPDYCGITVSVILDRAVKAFTEGKQTNTFRSAVAAYFKNNARLFGLRVDKTPRDGCLFLTKREGGSGYHVGFVWEVLNNQSIKTIEGNTWSGSSFHVKADGCKTKLNYGEYGILTRARLTSSIDCFVHIEEMFEDKNNVLVMDFPKSAAMLADKGVCNIEELDPNADGGDGVNTAGQDTGQEKLLGFIPVEYKPYLYIGGALLAISIIAYKRT